MARGITDSALESGATKRRPWSGGPPNGGALRDSREFARAGTAWRVRETEPPPSGAVERLDPRQRLLARHALAAPTDSLREDLDVPAPKSAGGVCF